MAKIFDRELEDKRIKRLNEDRWFMLHQKALLWLANTREGRDFFCIDQRFPKIHAIAKNYIKHYERVAIEPSKKFPSFKYTTRTTAEFRVGAKYANIIRYRWEEWQDLLVEYHVGLYLRTVPLAYVPDYAFVDGRAAQVFHTVSTFYPDPSPTTTTFDGRAFRINNNAGWNDIVTGAGTGSNDVSDPTTILYIDTGATNFSSNVRGFFLFDTSSIGNNQTVSSAILSLNGTAKGDTFSPAIAPSIDIYTSNPASNTAIANADYSNVGSISQTGSAITFANYNAAAYNDFTFNATGRSNVSLTGISKFSSRNANYDVPNTAPTFSANQSTNLGCNCAEASGLSTDPKLVVTYASSAVTAIAGTLLMMGI